MFLQEFEKYCLTLEEEIGIRLCKNVFAKANFYFSKANFNDCSITYALSNSKRCYRGRTFKCLKINLYDSG